MILSVLRRLIDSDIAAYFESGNSTRKYRECEHSMYLDGPNLKYTIRYCPLHAKTFRRMSNALHVVIGLNRYLYTAVAAAQLWSATVASLPHSSSWLSSLCIRQPKSRIKQELSQLDGQNSIFYCSSVPSPESQCTDSAVFPLAGLSTACLLLQSFRYARTSFAIMQHIELARAVTSPTNKNNRFQIPRSKLPLIIATE